MINPSLVIGKIPLMKSIDVTFTSNVKSKTFNYLNYQNNDDKEQIKVKFLQEGYLCLRIKDSSYDFFNFELINSSNLNLEHNVERNSSKKIISKKKLIYNPISILNCAFNLSPASRNANLLKNNGIIKLEPLIDDICLQNCSCCNLFKVKGNHTSIVSKYSRLNSLIFPSNYNGTLYLNHELKIKSTILDKLHENHISKFKLNLNLESYIEIKKTLLKIQENLHYLEFCFPPRFYTTFLIIEYIKKSKKQSLTINRLLNHIKNRIEEVSPIHPKTIIKKGSNLNNLKQFIPIEKKKTNKINPNYFKPIIEKNPYLTPLEQFINSAKENHYYIEFFEKINNKKIKIIYLDNGKRTHLTINQTNFKEVIFNEHQLFLKNN